MLIRKVAHAMALLIAFGACSQAAVFDSGRSVPRDAPDADTGITLAENAGATLVILSLDPADLGENTVRVALRDPGGGSVRGGVRLLLSVDGAAPIRANLPDAFDGRRGNLMVARPGRYRIMVEIADGPSAGGSVTFGVDLPAEAAPSGLLARVDGAMNALRALRETQTLASSGFQYVFRYEYEAPDRVHYTYVAPDGRQHETRIVGAKRFDRDTGGDWSTSDLGVASRAPNFTYADRSYRVRVIGREPSAGQDVLELALVQRRSVDLHYRLWVGAADYLVRRYVMMALGHYMTGSYSDFDAPLEIAPP